MNKPVQNSFSEKLSFADQNLLKYLCGEHDINIKLIEKLEPVRIKPWGNHLTVTGEEASVSRTLRLLGQLYSIMEKGWQMHISDIEYAHRILSEDISNYFAQQLDTFFVCFQRHRF